MINKWKRGMEGKSTLAWPKDEQKLEPPQGLNGDWGSILRCTARCQAMGMNQWKSKWKRGIKGECILCCNGEDNEKHMIVECSFLEGEQHLMLQEMIKERGSQW